ncbi:TPA: hypothetical protein ACH3X3_008625 [Trebouxia sp. C0006]
MPNSATAIEFAVESKRTCAELHKEAELEEVQQSPRLLLHKKQPLICFRATAGCRTAASAAHECCYQLSLQSLRPSNSICLTMTA